MRKSVGVILSEKSEGKYSRQRELYMARRNIQSKGRVVGDDVTEVGRSQIM